MRIASSSRSVPSASALAVYSGSSNETCDVALRREVVDLVGLHLLHDVDQAGGIGHVAVVQHEPTLVLVRILVEVIDAVGVEQRGAALDAVHLVSLVEQELGEIGAVLAGDAGDQSSFQKVVLLFSSHFMPQGTHTRGWYLDRDHGWTPIPSAA